MYSYLGVHVDLSDIEDLEVLLASEDVEPTFTECDVNEMIASQLRLDGYSEEYIERVLSYVPNMSDEELEALDSLVSLHLHAVPSVDDKLPDILECIQNNLFKKY